MTFPELIEYLLTPASLGVVSSLAMALLKRLLPAVTDDLAYLVSIVVAVVVSVAAHLLVPYVNVVQASLGPTFYILTWACSQLWYKYVTNA